MKTIKQLADELNVSKTTISKIIRKLKLQTKLQRVGNKFAISKMQESKIKSVLLEKNEIKNENLNRKPNDFECDPIFLLQKQLAEKEATIQSLLEKLDQEQKLHLVTIQEKNKLQIEFSDLKKNEDKKENKKSWWQFWK